jgi:hypothetical protein
VSGPCAPHFDDACGCMTAICGFLLPFIHPPRWHCQQYISEDWNSGVISFPFSARKKMSMEERTWSILQVLLCFCPPIASFCQKDTVVGAPRMRSPNPD